MRSLIAPALMGALALAGCQKKEEAAASPFGGLGQRGRFVAVGLYEPGQMWEQLTAAAPSDPAQATLKDDEQVIVAMDSATGELRQCGNLSGHCIGLNPWAKPLAAGHGAPTPLLKHAQQLQEEFEQEQRARERQLNKR